LEREQYLPPHILKKLLEEGRLGLKSQHGFYEYKQETGETMKRERDRRLFARLRLFREEHRDEKT